MQDNPSFKKINRRRQTHITGQMSANPDKHKPIIERNTSFITYKLVKYIINNNNKLLKIQFSRL